MTICALIPAYNEANTIADVVAAVRPHVARVVVVDDGSADDTAARARQAGATCFRFQQNQGKGAALRHALARISPAEFSHVLFMDADGQHRPEDVPAMVQKALATDADLVIGTRSFDKASMPRSRHFSNTVGSLLTSRLVGQPILDSQSGFRLARLARLRTLPLRARRYEFEMEVLIKLCSRGGRIAHSPVALVYNGGRARSKMHPVRDTVRICLWSLAYRYLWL